MKESDFQGVLGVSRDKLRWLRRGLEAGVHFVKEGRSVVYTESGQAEVRARIAAELGAAAVSGADGANGTDMSGVKPDPQSEPEIEELRVVRRVINPRIVFCAIDGAAPLQRVIVRNSQNFLPGMLVKARRVKGSADLWELQGRCPRWRGRW